MKIETTKNRLVIADARELKHSLTKIIKDGSTEEYSLGYDATHYPLHDSSTIDRIVEFFIKEFISSRSAFKQYKTHYFQEIGRTLFGCDLLDNKHTEITEAVLTDATVDNALVALNNELSNTIPSNTWNKWIVKYINGHHAIIGGEDIRNELVRDLDDEDEIVKINLSTLKQYLTSIYNLNREDAIILLTEIILTRYPAVKMKDGFSSLSKVARHDVVTNITNQCGFYNFNSFYEKELKHSFEMLVDYKQTIKINEFFNYSGSLSTNSIMELAELDYNVDTAHEFYDELTEAIEYGDWVSEKERSALSQFKRKYA